MRTIRVALKSDRVFGNDELLGRIREAVEAAKLESPEVCQDENWREAIVSFNVEASGLDTAPDVAAATLVQVLSEAGLEFPVSASGASD